MSTKKLPHHLIFEGAELTGKSFVISQIYNWLEKKYSSKNFPYLLDGCFWLNSDVGTFGLPEGKKLISNYVSLAENLKKYNLIFEKLHITDQVYSWLYRKKTVNYQAVEKKLAQLNFRIIFLEIDEEEKIFAQRLPARIKLHPHYQRICQSPRDYLRQQLEYKKFISKTNLPVLKINTTKLPNKFAIDTILKWLKEV